MKKLLALILIMLSIQSCGSNVVVVMDWKELVGIYFLAIIVCIGILAIVYEYLKSLFKK